MKFIEYESKGRVAYVHLNRPDKRNALNFELVSELKNLFAELEKDSSIKVVILKGNGDAFCAGADLAYLQQLQNNTYEENLADSEHLMELFYSIYTLNKVVIAQVEGFAIAGGAGLATVCDFCFATPESVFGYSEVRIGFVPAIVMVFLLRKISELNAKELLLTGRKISASEAQDIGLINRVISSDKIESEVKNFADSLVNKNSGQSMALTKQMIAAIQTEDLRSALNYAAEKNARARNFSDCKKGIEAFLSKKNISW